MRRVGAIVAVAAALLTAACAAGQQAQTAYEKPTLDGTYTSVGKIDLRGIVINAPDGPSYAVGDSASLTLVIVNTGLKADRLLSVSSPAITDWGSFTGGSGGTPSKSVEVLPGTRVGFGTPETTDVLLLTKLKQPLYPGTNVPLTFTFANAGTVTAPVPVALSSASPSTTVVAPSGNEGTPIGG